MQRNLVSGFDDSFRRHLAIEQRRAVLDTIARELGPDTTLGDIVDAANELGWSENFGELCLADLAVALAGEDAAEPPAAVTATSGDGADEDDEEEEDEVEADAEEDEEEDEDDEEEEDEDEDEDEEEEEEDEEEEEVAPARRGKNAGKQSSMDRALDRIDRALARGRKSSKPEAKAAKPAAKKAAKKPAKKASKAADDDSEAMSLDQAAKLLIPLVRKLKEATMQDLEEQTGMGRRKLRFHIGQLVKHGRLKRHGMGRGTCYTVK
ncbi:MAG: hypothetical protein JNL82_28245 [Myxococcales bacterium]|nr:hypothetical protein [Myxococcales bacterium]